MANKNAPFGFRPARHLTGGTIREAKYNIASALAANIGVGSIVVETGTSGANGRPYITLAAADGAQTGVFMGVKYRDPNTGDVVYARRWVSGQTTFNSEDAEAIVIDDPAVVYEIQMSGALAAANIGLLADLVIGAPNAQTGRATTAVDSADLAGSAVKILGLAPIAGNELGTYGIVEVLLGNAVPHERTAV